MPAQITPAQSYIRLNRSVFRELIRFRNIAELTAASAQIALQRTEAALHQLAACGVSWEGQRLLEIGSGQILRYTLPFSTVGHVVGIDTELPLETPLARSFVDEARHSGIYRAGKSLANVLLGRQRAYRTAVQRALGRPFDYELRRMDAGRLAFADRSFGGAFSLSVFEHLPEPERALREVARCLRPGARLYLDLHLYTSPNGDHDPRGLKEMSGWTPWQHLLGIGPPAPCYLNRIRLPQWHEMIDRVFKHVTYIAMPGERERNARHLATTDRSRLRDYSEDELLTTTLVAVAGN